MRESVVVDKNEFYKLMLLYTNEYQACVSMIARMHWKDKTWEDTASEHGYSIHVLLSSNRCR